MAGRPRIQAAAFTKAHSASAARSGRFLRHEAAVPALRASGAVPAAQGGIFRLRAHVRRNGSLAGASPARPMPGRRRASRHKRLALSSTRLLPRQARRLSRAPVPCRGTTPAVMPPPRAAGLPDPGRPKAGPGGMSRVRSSAGTPPRRRRARLSLKKQGGAGQITGTAASGCFSGGSHAGNPYGPQRIMTRPLQRFSRPSTSALTAAPRLRGGPLPFSAPPSLSPSRCLGSSPFPQKGAPAARGFPGAFGPSRHLGEASEAAPKGPRAGL
jgi:hypothetical protein